MFNIDWGRIGVRLLVVVVVVNIFDLLRLTVEYYELSHLNFTLSHLSELA